MVRTKKAVLMARKEKAAKKNRTKKFDKFSKYKKHAKLPLDATPWEELSKNIKGKFKSKSETEDELQSKNQLIVSEDCGNDANIHTVKSCIESIIELNSLDVNNVQLEKVSLKNCHEPKHKKKKKLKIKLDTSTENIIKVEHVHENNQSDISEKLDQNNDCESSNAKGHEFSPAEQLSKCEKKKLKKQKEKIMRRRLEKNKLYEKKRLERRKELGMMLLPKNVENRLLRIRKALRKKNLPSEEIKRIMREERKKAQDEFCKSQGTQMCFNCRKPGHLVANCPLNEDNKAKSICLKCGSTEHKYNKCNQEITGFPFATCFICKEQGHISRDCPINEHGIYPKGGKCSLCDSVKHLRKDCPTLKKKVFSLRLHTIDNGTSIDDEVMDKEEETPKVKTVKPKVVTF